MKRIINSMLVLILTFSFVIQTYAGNNDQATVLAITTQPVNYIGSIGDPVSFTVEATGEGLTYQWKYSSNRRRSYISVEIQ